MRHVVVHEKERELRGRGGSGAVEIRGRKRDLRIWQLAGKGTYPPSRRPFERLVGADGS